MYNMSDSVKDEKYNTVETPSIFFEIQTLDDTT